MSKTKINVKCPRCGRRWDQDLSRLDKADRVVYREVGETRDYRVRCPQCGTVKIVTVAVGEEAGDD